MKHRTEKYYSSISVAQTVRVIRDVLSDSILVSVKNMNLVQCLITVYLAAVSCQLIYIQMPTEAVQHM